MSSIPLAPSPSGADKRDGRELPSRYVSSLLRVRTGHPHTPIVSVSPSGALYRETIRSSAVCGLRATRRIWLIRQHIDVSQGGGRSILQEERSFSGLRGFDSVGLSIKLTGGRIGCVGGGRCRRLLRADEVLPAPGVHFARPGVVLGYRSANAVQTIETGAIK
jgi:hypothetical protein